MRCIDVHHHFFPSGLDKESLNQNMGWRTPPGTLPWSPATSLQYMDASGIDIAILSFPALDAGSNATWTIVRERNLYAANIVKQHPGRFRFFAGLPLLDDTEIILGEVAYALDSLGAIGFSLNSSYGQEDHRVYIGDERFDPIWAELDRRAAVVFIHGTQVAPTLPSPHPTLCVPVVEVPHETFKAAAHLVVTGRKRKYSKVKIILAHMGGGTAMLASRVAVLSNHLGCPHSAEEMMQDFGTFYYETALSASLPALAAMDMFVKHDHVLFGSDFPAVNAQMAEWYTNETKKYYMKDEQKLDKIMSGNAIDLFPALKTLLQTPDK